MNAFILMQCEGNASQLRNPIEHAAAQELLWSYRRQRAYQKVLVEAVTLVEHEKDMTLTDLIFWINERVETAHKNGEGV